MRPLSGSDITRKHKGLRNRKIGVNKAVFFKRKACVKSVFAVKSDFLHAGWVVNPQLYSSVFKCFHVCERFMSRFTLREGKSQQSVLSIWSTSNSVLWLVNRTIHVWLTRQSFVGRLCISSQNDNKARAERSRGRFGMAARLNFWLTLGGFSVSFLCADFLDRLNVTRVKSAAYDELFADGVRAYSAEKWSEAVELLEKAIADYNHEKELKLHCRLRCRDRYRASSAHNVISDLELDYYRYTIYCHKCAKQCREKYLGKRTKVSAAVRSDFELRVPYGYLQFAYYKVSY